MKQIGGLWREYVLSEFGGHRRTVAVATAGETPAVAVSQRKTLIGRLSFSTLSLVAAAACVLAIVAGGIAISTHGYKCLFAWSCIGGAPAPSVAPTPTPVQQAGRVPCVILCDVGALQPAAAAAPSAPAPVTPPIVTKAVTTPLPPPAAPPAAVPAPAPLQTVGGVVQQLGSGLAGAVTGVVNGLVNTLVPALTPVVAGVGQVVTGTVNTLTGTVSGLLNLLSGAAHH